TIEYFQTDLFTSITIITLVVISIVVPYICHTRRKIGRRFKILSLLVRTLFGHRTFTHSLLFISLIIILLYLIQTPDYYLVSIIFGLLSHVILDMLTPRGVKLLYPIQLTIKLLLVFRTAGLEDLSLSGAITTGAIYVLLQSFFNNIFLNL